ncbi:MAG TPA: hypothetical protein VKX17_20980 [Planctomycetota bacterium]|nr:hypothetical protein [Planctomycetota bacterium]
MSHFIGPDTALPQSYYVQPQPSFAMHASYRGFELGFELPQISQNAADDCAKILSVGGVLVLALIVSKG